MWRSISNIDPVGGAGARATRSVRRRRAARRSRPAGPRPCHRADPDHGRAGAAVRLTRKVRACYPELPIIARARDPEHAAELYRAGASDAVPETLESSLQLSEAVLVDLGVAMGPVIASIHEKRDELRASRSCEMGDRLAQRGSRPQPERRQPQRRPPRSSARSSGPSAARTISRARATSARQEPELPLERERAAASSANATSSRTSRWPRIGGPVLFDRPAGRGSRRPAHPPRRGRPGLRLGRPSGRTGAAHASTVRRKSRPRRCTSPRRPADPCALSVPPTRPAPPTASTALGPRRA